MDTMFTIGCIVVGFGTAMAGFPILDLEKKSISIKGITVYTICFLLWMLIYYMLDTNITTVKTGM